MVLHDCKEIIIIVRYCNDKRGEKMIMFKYDYYDKNAALYIMDSLNGIVRYQDHNGNLHIKLMLDEKESAECGSSNNALAFGYWTGKVSPGTRVTCTVRKFATETRDIQVRIDSVEYDAEIAA